MSSHNHEAIQDSDPRDPPFLIDGCIRCLEYADELGIHFTADRFVAFWRYMVDVEFEADGGAYKSRCDRKLGGKLYLFALSLQRAGVDPKTLFGDGDGQHV